MYMIGSLASIKSYHLRKERENYLRKEEARLQTYQKAVMLLRAFGLEHPQTEIYLFGSILQQGRFHDKSDIDIAFKNSPLDRLELYAHWSYLLKREMDIIILENCDFAADIIKWGEKVS